MVGEGVTWSETFWETHRSWLHLDNHKVAQVSVCQGVLAHSVGWDKYSDPEALDFIIVTT